VSGDQAGLRDVNLQCLLKGCLNQCSLLRGRDAERLSAIAERERVEAKKMKTLPGIE
jgi:hypothetical protein